MTDYHRGGDRHERMPPLPTRDMMGSRIYVGKLPNDIREREIEREFRKFGDIKDISLKGNYCFIQFERSGAAKDAVHDLNDRTLFGSRILVQHARTPKEFGGFRSRSSYGSGGGSRYGYRDSDRDRSPRRHRSPRRERSPARSDYRLNVTNLSTRCDRHDLKAVMEKAGEVLYADAHRKKVGEGVVEFASRKDMERALKKLDGLEINAKPIKLEIEEDKESRRSGSRSRSRSRSGSRKRSDSERSGSGSDKDDDEADKSKDDGDDEKDETKTDNEEDMDASANKEESETEGDKDESMTKDNEPEADEKEEKEEEETTEQNGHAEEESQQETPAEGETEPSNTEESTESTEVAATGTGEETETEEVEETVEEEVEEEVEVEEEEEEESQSANNEHDDSMDGQEATGTPLADEGEDDDE